MDIQKHSSQESNHLHFAMSAKNCQHFHNFFFIRINLLHFLILSKIIKAKREKKHFAFYYKRGIATHFSSAAYYSSSFMLFFPRCGIPLKLKLSVSQPSHCVELCSSCFHRIHNRIKKKNLLFSTIVCTLKNSLMPWTKIKFHF